MDGGIRYYDAKAFSVNPEPTRGRGKISSPIAREGLKFELEVLSKACQVMDRGGLTKAGRALQKHGGRPGSIFPKPSGNVTKINQHGQDILDRILTHPDNKSSFWKHRSFGDVVDISIPGQGGARFRRKVISLDFWNLNSTKQSIR